MQCLQELKALPALLSSSMKEIKKVSSLTGCAMLTALNVAISQFRIVISNILEISFSSVMVGASALLYGPMITALAGGIADTLKFIARPTGPYFPGFTINEILLGFIYGLFFYKKKVTLKRTFAAKLTVTIIINLILTPIWLNILYGQAFLVLLSARIVKNIVMLPIETAFLYFVLKTAEKVKTKT